MGFENQNVRGELLGRDKPDSLGVIAGAQFATPGPGLEKDYNPAPVAVKEGADIDDRPKLDLKARLFLNLPAGGPLDRFVGIDVAGGECPAAPPGLVAAANEDDLAV